MLIRRKLAVHKNCKTKTKARALPTLTIGLSSLDFLEKGLEPTERRSVTANPEELDPLERTKSALLLAVPDMLENRGERRYTW